MFYIFESVEFESTRIRSYDRQRTSLERLPVSGAECYCWAVSLYCCEMARSVSALELLNASFIEGGYSERSLLLLMFFVLWALVKLKKCEMWGSRDGGCDVYCGRKLL